MKKIVAIAMLVFSCQGLHAQYVDSLEYYLNHDFKPADKKRSYVYYKKAYKSSDGQWDVITINLRSNKLHENAHYLDDSLTVKDGKYQLYYDNGQLHQDVSYFKNNRVGLWRVYGINGQLLDSARYKSTGMPFHKSYSWNIIGQLTHYGECDMSGNGAGYETGFNDDSSICFYGKYVAGHLKDSVWAYLYSNGKPSLIETYDSGKLVAYECFDAEGNKQTGQCDTIRRVAEPSYKANQYLSMNIKMPREALDRELFGFHTVWVQFLVDIDGTLKDFKVVSGSYDFFNVEALRVARMMPAWKPARQYNRNLKSYHMLPINFVIE